jgi:hypothetical protein
MTSRLPMTQARWAILAAGLPVALAVLTVTGWFWVHGAVKALVNANQVGYRVSLTAPLSQGTASVATANAGLVLHAGRASAGGIGGRGIAGRGRAIRVRGYLSGALVRPVFEHTQAPAGLRLDPQCPAPVGDCLLGFTVTVPRGVPVRASSSFGTLHAGRLRGTVTLSASSGDLDVSRLAGHLRLTDRFGSVHASGLSGRVVMAGNSGDIDVSGLTGDAQLTDHYGNITADGVAAGDVRCQDQSGDITLTFTKVPRSVDVSDSFGNITLRLPPGPARYRVSMHDPMGHTSVRVPQSRSAPHVITATNNSGDITITS